MSKVFEDRFTEVQHKMIQACLEYVDNRADYIYIYASCEYPSISSDFFYKINGETLERYKLGQGYDTSPNRQSACLHALITYIKELREICKECDKEMPTEIKIEYDIKQNKVNAAYRYDLVYTNNRRKSAQDVAEEWFKKIKAEENSD